MAFGGSRWTKDFAVSTVRYTVSVGAKLFVLQLLVSIGTGLIQSWANSFTDVTAASLCILIGCSIVMLALGEGAARDDAAHRQRLQHGERLRTGGRGGSRRWRRYGSRRPGNGSVPARWWATPCGSPAHRWTLLMRRPQRRAAAKRRSGPRISRAAAMTGYTARNLVSAPLADVGRRLSGQRTAARPRDLAHERRPGEPPSASPGTICNKPTPPARRRRQHHQLEAPEPP